MRFFTVTGTDPLSALAVASLEQVGVDISGVRLHADVGPTIASIFTNGVDKRMVGSGPRNTASHWTQLVGDIDFTGYDHVHTIARLHPLLFAGGRRGDLINRPVSADLNGNYSPQIVADFDLCFTNHDEVSRYTGNPIGRLVAADLADTPYCLVVTRAAEDVSCYRNDGVLRVTPSEVTPIDRTGSGDAFCAGYLHATWLRRGPEHAIEAGLRLAAATLLDLGPRPDTTETREALAILTGLEPARL